MSLTGPAHAGYYVDRSYECKRALQPLFHFSYLEIILAKVTEPALSAGWTYRDIRQAVTDLALEHQRAESVLIKVRPSDEPPGAA